VIESEVQERYDKAFANGLGLKGFVYYSRVKLWDETCLVGKDAVSALTDDEFQRALYNIDRYFKKHATLIGQWGLKKNAGPQSAADRDVTVLVEYLGSPRRYMWYSATIFKQELAKWSDGCSIVADLAEGDFLELLQRTSSRAANHGWVRNYMTAFSGPQSWVQRLDAAFMEIEPVVQGRAVEYRPKDFAWLQCGREECHRWRRVDLATARVFSNWHWLQHERDERRAALCESFPRLPALLARFAAWSGGSASISNRWACRRRSGGSIGGDCSNLSRSSVGA